MTTSMGKKRSLIALVACMALASLALPACSTQSASTPAAESESDLDSEPSASIAADSQTTTAGTGAIATFGAAANTLAQDEEALVAEYAEKFTQETYADADTGLSVTYNLFLPQGYDASESYPMVVFIADSSCAKGDAEQSLTQGLGALVWATDEWQAAYPCIVCVPTYPETILDDHSGYTTTEYVELTKRLIESVANSYAVDTNRIYGTGQSMGCMTTLILASEYPDLYAACMFVDGQWDVSVLKELEGQKFVYFAAEDDASAYSGMSEVMAMFDADSVSYASAQWDGTWSCDELTAAAEELFSSGDSANFISWMTGTIDAGGVSMSGPGAPGGPDGGMGGPGAPGGSDGGDASGAPHRPEDAGAGAADGMGGMGGASYHMASFDYAYNCVAVMEWLFQQAS